MRALTTPRSGEVRSRRELTIMRRKGKHTPQREQAVQEQIQAAQIRQTVEATEHYKMLVERFGPRSKVVQALEDQTLTVTPEAAVALAKLAWEKSG